MNFVVGHFPPQLEKFGFQFSSRQYFVTLIPDFSPQQRSLPIYTKTLLLHLLINCYVIQHVWEKSGGGGRRTHQFLHPKTHFSESKHVRVKKKSETTAGSSGPMVKLLWYMSIRRKLTPQSLVSAEKLVPAS